MSELSVNHDELGKLMKVDEHFLEYIKKLLHLEGQEKESEHVGIFGNRVYDIQNNEWSLSKERRFSLKNLPPEVLTWDSGIVSEIENGDYCDCFHLFFSLYFNAIRLQFFNGPKGKLLVDRPLPNGFFIIFLKNNLEALVKFPGELFKLIWEYEKNYREKKAAILEPFLNQQVYEGVLQLCHEKKQFLTVDQIQTLAFICNIERTLPTQKPYQQHVARQDERRIADLILLYLATKPEIKQKLDELEVDHSILVSQLSFTKPKNDTDSLLEALKKTGFSGFDNSPREKFQRKVEQKITESSDSNFSPANPLVHSTENPKKTLPLKELEGTQQTNAPSHTNPIDHTEVNENSSSPTRINEIVPHYGENDNKNTPAQSAEGIFINFNDLPLLTTRMTNLLKNFGPVERQLLFDRVRILAQEANSGVKSSQNELNRMTLRLCGCEVTLGTNNQLTLTFQDNKAVENFQIAERNHLNQTRQTDLLTWLMIFFKAMYVTMTMQTQKYIDATTDIFVKNLNNFPSINGEPQQRHVNL